MHLTARDTAIAALKAYDEKRLSAQGPFPACVYMDPTGRPCAVGAAMPPEFAQVITSAGPVSNLIVDALITCPEGDEPKLLKLQMLHDVWAQNATDPDRAAQLEAEFVTYAKGLAA